MKSGIHGNSKKKLKFESSVWISDSKITKNELINSKLSESVSFSEFWVWVLSRNSTQLKTETHFIFAFSPTTLLVELGLKIILKIFKFIGWYFNYTIKINH